MSSYHLSELVPLSLYHAYWDTNGTKAQAKQILFHLHFCSFDKTKKSWVKKKVYCFILCNIVYIAQGFSRFDNTCLRLNYQRINVVKYKLTSPNNLILNILKWYQYSFSTPTIAVVLFLSLLSNELIHTRCVPAHSPLSLLCSILLWVFKFPWLVLVKMKTARALIESTFH